MNIISENFSDLFSREFEKLRTELKAYHFEDDIWKKVIGIDISAGNLIFNIIRILRYHFLNISGNTDQVQIRHFSSEKDITREELIIDLNEIEKLVIEILTNLNEADFKKIFPKKFNDKSITTHWLLIHLYGVLTNHLTSLLTHRKKLGY